MNLESQDLWAWIADIGNTCMSPTLTTSCKDPPAEGDDLLPKPLYLWSARLKDGMEGVGNIAAFEKVRLCSLLYVQCIIQGHQGLVYCLPCYARSTRRSFNNKGFHETALLIFRREASTFGHKCKKSLTCWALCIKSHLRQSSLQNSWNCNSTHIQMQWPISRLNVVGYQQRPDDMEHHESSLKWTREHNYEWPAHRRLLNTCDIPRHQRPPLLVPAITTCWELIFLAPGMYWPTLSIETDATPNECNTETKQTCNPTRKQQRTPSCYFQCT